MQSWRELVSLGWRVVVVDDGSRDDTFQQANAQTLHVLRHVLNLGQGAALQTGIDYALSAGADAIVTLDADGQHKAADVASLADALDGADVALGSHCGLRAFRATAAPSLRITQDRMAHASEL
ncbi:MAG: glycosyltransferase family 2 protein [Candidatus Binatia bacterium]